MAKATKKSTKTTVKKTISEKTQMKTSEMQLSAGQKARLKLKSLRTRRSYIFLIVIIFILGALLYYGRGVFVAAVVNGQPITRLAIVKEAERHAGKQALDTVITASLVDQEARKANVVVSEKEVNDEIKNIESTVLKQGQKLDDVLALRNMTRDDLHRVVRFEKIFNKMYGKDIKATDKEITAYLDSNKDSLPTGQSEDQLKKYAAQKVVEQKSNEKFQTWIESLKAKAKIIYFVQY